jgi:hypothetical protein
MATAIDINGLTYYIPDVGEQNWGQNVTDAIIALAAGISGGGFFTVVSVASSPISVLSGRTYLVNTGAPRQLNLPAPAANAYCIVRDATGTASANAITLHRNGGESIDGVAADKTLNIDSGIWWLFSDGTNWFTLLNSGGILNKDIAAAAAIARAKIATGTANHVLINAADGTLSSEAALAVSRGGTNSGAALNNGRIMKSLGGSIVEAAAITGNKALASDANGIPVASAVTDTELGYLTGVTSAIQTQLESLQLYRRNAIINGDARINQRGTAYTLVKDAYGIGPDRFYGMATGTAVSAGTLAQVSNSPCGRTGYAFKIAGATITGTGIVYLRHRIESFESLRFKNQTASFSCRVYQDTGGAVNYTVYVRKANTADTFSAVTAIANSGQVSIPSGADTLLKCENISMGDCSNGIEIEIKVECGAITTKNFYFTELQLEQGATATAFEWIPYAQTVQLCQRYYEKSYDIGTAIGTNGATGYYRTKASSTDYIWTIPFKVSKRVAPTITLYDTGPLATGVIRDLVLDATKTASTNNISQHCFSAYNTQSFGGATNTLGHHWSADCEL